MRLLLLFITTLPFFSACGQHAGSATRSSATATETLLKPSRVIFYNVENLFDTINDPETKDEDFLPEGSSQWNSRRYQKKLKNLSKVLADMCDTIPPLAIGLCEIENRKVLDDLIAQPALKKYNLGIAHVDSKDERGIDVALLYNKNYLEEVFTATLKVNLKGDKTRDILYFKAFIGEEYPIWFFVNHWPSRREGEKESELKRITAAKTLQSKLSNLYEGEPYARVIIMGDFNDNPENESIKILQQTPSKLSGHQSIQNLSEKVLADNGFTLKHQGQNHVFDQMLVSKNLTDKANQYYLRTGTASVFSPDYLLFDHPKYGLIPNRTYANGKYTGGYSDHLPVYFDIIFK